MVAGISGVDDEDELNCVACAYAPCDARSQARSPVDLAGQVTSLIHQGPNGVLQSLEYTYGDDGQRTKIVREDGTRIYYSYNAAHRLTGGDWLDPSDVHLYAFAHEY